MQNTNVKRRLLSKNYNNTVYLKLGEKIKTQSRRSGGFFMSMEKLQKKKPGLDDKTRNKKWTGCHARTQPATVMSMEA